MSSVVTNFGSDIALGFGPSLLALTFSDSMNLSDSFYGLPSTFDFKVTFVESLFMDDSYVSAGVSTAMSLNVGDALVMMDHLP